jgi:hypothetical protein
VVVMPSSNSGPVLSTTRCENRLPVAYSERNGAGRLSCSPEVRRCPESAELKWSWWAPGPWDS